MMVLRTNTAQLAKQTFPWLVIMDRPEGWPPLPAPCPAWSPPPPPPVMEALVSELSAAAPLVSELATAAPLVSELAAAAALLPFLLAAACATLQALSWKEQ